MKHLKTKLITSVMMLLIAALMVSTASYAWFTLSTKPEIKGVKDTVVVNENLEIAKVATASAAPTAIPGVPAAGDTIYLDPTAGDAGNTTWGNLVVRDDAGTLRPAALSAASSKVTLKLAATTLEAAQTEAEAYLVKLLKNGYTVKNADKTKTFALNSDKNGLATDKPAITPETKDSTGNTVIKAGDYKPVFNKLNKGELTASSTVVGYTVDFVIDGKWFEYPEYMPDGRIKADAMIGLAPQPEQYGFGQLDDINDQNYVTFFDTWVRTNMPDQVLDLQEKEANRSAGAGTNNGEGTFYMTDFQGTGKNESGGTVELYGGNLTVAKGATASTTTLTLVPNDYGKAALDYVKAVRIAFQDVTPDIKVGTEQKTTPVTDAKIVVANEDETNIETFVKLTADVGTNDATKLKAGEYKFDDDFKTKFIAAIGDISTTDKAYEYPIKVAYKKFFNTNGTNATNGTEDTTGDVRDNETTEAIEKEAGLYICELVANEAKIIRTYIYLDGEQVTNASASYYGDKADVATWGDPNDNENGKYSETAKTSVDTGTNLPNAFANAGKLNLQFQAADVEYSMDGLTDATRHVYTEK